MTANDSVNLTRTAAALDAYDRADRAAKEMDWGACSAQRAAEIIARLDILAEDVGRQFGIDTADRNDPDTCTRCVRPCSQWSTAGESFVRRMVRLWRAATAPESTVERRPNGHGWAKHKAEANGVPFRAPHYTVSLASMLGECERAAGGVLYLAPLAEYRRAACEAVGLVRKKYRIRVIWSDPGPPSGFTERAAEAYRRRRTACERLLIGQSLRDAD